MKKNTTERAKRNRQADKLRKEFVEQFRNCWVCGTWGTQCHEICQGGSRAEAIHHPENFLAVCHTCHAAIHADKEKWPVAKQIALAWFRGDYQLGHVLAVCNDMLTRQVYESEVMEWVTLKSLE